jgi:hypothetical protein
VDEDTQDHKLFTDIAEKMAHYNGYTYGNAKDGIIYNTNGDADDWFYGEQGTLAYTFELGTMFIPPESMIDDPHKIYPSLSVYTDKTNYFEGDVMEIGLSVTNPHDALQVGIYIWASSPSGSKYWVVSKPSVNLPQDINFNDPLWKTYTLPGLQAGEYTWNAVLIDPSTKYVLNESISDWYFSTK